MAHDKENLTQEEKQGHRLPSPEALRRAIKHLEAPLREADPSWSVFGSCALLLNGVPGIEAHDVDILLSAHGLRHLMKHMPQVELLHDDQPDSRFRSLHARIVLDGIEIDLSGNLEIRLEGKWRPVQVRQVLEDGGVRYASPQDCARMLQLFGRQKDLSRLEALRDWATCHRITLPL